MRPLRHLKSIFARFQNYISEVWYHEKALGSISWSIATAELRAFRCFALQIFEYCSAEWCSAAYLQGKLLDKVVRSSSFLASDHLECNLAHRRFVAVLSMLFTIKSNPLHLLSGTLPLSYVQARVTHGVLVLDLQRYLRIRTDQLVFYRELRILIKPTCHQQSFFRCKYCSHAVHTVRGSRERP